MRVAVTNRLWVGDEGSLLCETASAASYFLELPGNVQVTVPDFEAADEALRIIGMTDEGRQLMLSYAKRRWESGYPD